MERVGIEQLERDASAILKRVRDHHETIEVTHRGTAVARIVPVISDEERQRRLDTAWALIDELSEEISERWPAGVSAAQAVREGRREL